MTSLSSPSSKWPRTSVKTVYEKQDRDLDLQLELLENQNVKKNYQFDKFEKEE